MGRRKPQDWQASRAAIIPTRLGWHNTGAGRSWVVGWRPEQPHRDPGSRTEPAGPVDGFYADGYGGQYIAVAPASDIVAVRTITPPDDASNTTEFDRTSFFGFPLEAAKLVHGN